MLRLLDDLYGAVGSGPSEHKQAILDDLRLRLPDRIDHEAVRLAAYCSRTSLEVFHAIAHAHEVFEPDPLDVDAIHSDARSSFARLVDRAATSTSKFGKMLLIKGESGSGKTHLMRAFRNQVHGEQLGFCGYMQMSTQASNYSRYVLVNLVESLQQPYWQPSIRESGLLCLSDALAHATLSDVALAALRNDVLSAKDLGKLVSQLVDRILQDKRFAHIEVDLLRCMLYLQRREPHLTSRAMKFLRCEGMNRYDREMLGDIVPLDDEAAPSQMLVHLGRLIAAVENGALVLLLDQLEDVSHLDKPAERFRLAMDALRHVTDHVPTSVIVIACLEDFYVSLRDALSRSVLDRLESDPEPMRLTVGRSCEEIELLIECRLRRLFEAYGTSPLPGHPTFPLSRDIVANLANLRTRDVLDYCRKHHEKSIEEGRVSLPDDPGPDLPRPDPTIEMSRAWNDFRTTAGAPPEEDEALAALLAQSVESCTTGRTDIVVTAKCQASHVDIVNGEVRLAVALCNRDARGGALSKQVDAARARAQEKKAVCVIVRCAEFPPPGSSQIAKKLKELFAAGGRKLVATDADWREMNALRQFCAKMSVSPDLVKWLAKEQPLRHVSLVRSLLEAASVGGPTEQRQPSVRPSKPVPEISTPKPHDSPSGSSNGQSAKCARIPIGTTRSLNSQPVFMTPDAFTTHAAFLGSTKSGKTTLALNIIEQLAVAGTPSVLIDRKGDLATYGLADFWREPAPEPHLQVRKQTLRDKLDVRVYTPGHPNGRPLQLPVVPPGLNDLAVHERAMLARYAAAALGAMMGYKHGKGEDTRLGILGKAIELLSGAPGGEQLGIEQLVGLLHDEDPDLVAAVGMLDTKHFHALVQSLETLRLRYEHLLTGEGELLSPEMLFGIGPDGKSGRTRFSVINTKYLGDNAAVDFWVSRLLVELSRWAARHPAPSLQAVLFLDEADIYLPAQSKPATKEPLLDLLKRARSAGLGVFIATQSPGDLDYRCRDNIRTWFVGRVAEKTAVDKMKPLLSDCRTNVSAKLATSQTGEFFRLADGEVIELKAGWSVMKTVQLGEEQILRVAREGVGR